MNNRDKSALALALAIVGGIAAGMRCDASVTVETPTQINPRVAAYTVKTYTGGSDPFDAVVALCLGINHILDMFETACNVAGDNVCTYIVEKKGGLMRRADQ